MIEYQGQLDVFIKGELIDLCIPTKDFAEKSDWYSWFNDPKLNRYLEQGLFPNCSIDQVEFFEMQRKKRLLLIISSRRYYIGVISFSEIDFMKRKACVALVVNKKTDDKYAPILALEAMARISEHGFKYMGLDRIWAGQHRKLIGWQQRMELLGYRLEGILRKNFAKGREISDSVTIAANYEDYLRIVEQRGKYWDSSDKMLERINKLPKEIFADKLKSYFDTEGNKYYDQIFSL